MAARSLLCLLDSSTSSDAGLWRELAFLSPQPGITLLATRQTPLPPRPVPSAQVSTLPSPILPEYLPDATVLEAAWRAHPTLAAQAESLRSEAGPVDGELYYLTARRAVHLASQVSVRGWKKIHALRANSVLLAWLLHRLTGLPAGAVIEATHQESRTILTKLLPAFTWGSNSDPKLKSSLPDLLKLHAPTPAKRLLGIKLAPAAVPVVDPPVAWTPWLNHPN